ncbi:MAG: 2OG-Fe(II) oxygenase [Gammaproteobacteria bacterium]|nr:2OG-Fe(II) oxygenase [Gammaproteobacteria bacterium]
MKTDLQIAARDDLAHLQHYFAAHNRVQISDVLTQDTAQALLHALKNQQQWNIVWNEQGKHVDMDFDGVMQLPSAQLSALIDKIYRQASDDFQYFYANIPLYDIYQHNRLPGHFFNTIYQFINSEPLLELARRVTGFDQIEFADAQITRYSAGHFLTQHDDDVKGKGRLAAYVLNLTPTWRPDWGGALVFPDAERGFSEALYPCFNALNLFAVPQNHLVSMVSSFATEHRYSITGWLRSSREKSD